MTERTPRHHLARVCALLALLLLAGACSDDDGGDSSSSGETTTTDGDTTGTTDADESTTTTDDSSSSGDVDTTGLLDFLNEEDEGIGALFDWNTGDGVIAIDYLGVQSVGLYAVDVDEATATEACELASTYVFDIDPDAELTVYTGGYSDGVAVVARTGEAGTCAPAA